MVNRMRPTPDVDTWLVLTQYYPPEIGAPQIRLRCLVRELQRHGKAVLVRTAMPSYPEGRIHSGYRGQLFRTELIDNVEVRRTWAFAATGKSTLMRLLNYCCFALTVLPAVLFGARPDVCFVEAQPLPLGIVALLLKLFRGVPYIYNVPDLQVDVARDLGFLRSSSALSAARKLETLLLRNAMSVSTVSVGFMNHMRDRGVSADRITFLPNGADTNLMQPRSPESSMIERFGVKRKFTFVYVGTHAFYHGLDTLVAAAELLKEDPTIRILMVGHGPERDRIRQLVEAKALPNVVFGEVPYEETAELYSIAHAALAMLRNLPVAEGMRLSKIFPALSCGVPVIYSGAGEAADLLTVHGCGLVTPPEDAAALATTIRSLASNPTFRNELGARGRQYVEEQYSWSTIVERWLAALSGLRAGPRESLPIQQPTAAD